MTNGNKCWERLSSVIRWSNMTINAFGRHVGLVRSENLYQIKAGRNGISQNLARRVVEKFPEISLGWLLSGEGEMFGDVARGRIPYYEADLASCGVLRGQAQEASSYITMPFSEECSCALRSYDKAMSSEIVVGSIVFLQQKGVDAIIPGQLYVIVTRNFVILRRVRIKELDSSDRQLLLEPSDEGFDAMSVAQSEVEQIYKVVGNLKMI
ncbi:MAG: hypothetical protein IKZ11_04830 [Alistipes sp.]|nr:hypothetical protein [Alistipes sp.]